MQNSHWHNISSLELGYVFNDSFQQFNVDIAQVLAM